MSASAHARFITDAFWILLGRAPSSTELRDEARNEGAEARRALLTRLVTSPESDRLRQDLSDGAAASEAIENGLRSLGTDTALVNAAYECLFGRAADEGGLSHYSTALARGDSRLSVLRSLLASGEFNDRYKNLAPQNGAIPRDVQLCELANPAKWDNPEWVDILTSLGLATDKLSMHRKPYEFAQLIYGCRRLGALRPDSSIVSVGAGHELVLYWLANHAAHVVATDMYEGVWQDVQGREGDPDVLANPDDYAPFPYRKDHLRFMKMDGRQLTFPDGTFDISYSLSSIEHFGGVPGAAATIREMGRVLKPGGILALATEYVLAGPPHEETFQPAEFMGLIDQAGLELVEPIDTNVYKRYSFTPIDLYKNPYQSPHMVVRFNDTVFTTVFVFLRRRG
ncbi:MAG TPA: class I SAM-dependent methyltransferase [Vicinamibacterales bacterium]|jgi:SAM-dependent methyltransferase|nr:class I SAM-dependent methyltransferase [Vicinamibacterales bacterium]